MTHPHSLRKELRILFLVLWLLLILLIFTFTHFTRQILTQEIRSANENMLTLYSAQFDSLCTTVSRALADMAEHYEDTTPDPDQLSSQLARDVLLYDEHFSFYYADTQGNDRLFQTVSDTTINERNDFVSYMDSLMQDPPADTQWQIVSAAHGTYLTRSFYSSKGYYGAWISLQGALQLYQGNRFPEGAVLLFQDGDGNVLASTAQYMTQGNSLDTARSLLLSVPTTAAGLSFSLQIPYRIMFRSLYRIEFMALLVLLGMIVCIPFLRSRLHTLIFAPVDTITAAIDQVGKGDLTVQIASGGALEFQKIGTSFNHMVSEIHHLQVDVYQKEIARQKLELETLQQQIKPHFYLNCLNIIYNLAQAKEYANIQELCMAQVKYFRYMLKSAFSPVTVKDEFDHLHNYLHVQQLRYPDRLSIDLDLYSELESLQIPPFTLHVFAENVVKHASAYGQIRFYVTVSVYDDHYAQILISDNGPGYPPEVMEQLNIMAQAGNAKNIEQADGTHVGLSNTIRRLQLFYHNDVYIRFFNEKPHGAGAEIRIPRRPS